MVTIGISDIIVTIDCGTEGIGGMIGEDDDLPNDLVENLFTLNLVSLLMVLQFRYISEYYPSIL